MPASGASGSGTGTAESSASAYGCSGTRVQLVDGRDLDDPAEVHDRDPVGDVADDAEVVRDEHERQPQLALQVAQEVQDLRLDRHVERRDGLVADDEPRVRGERPREADALALAARELVRVALRVRGGEARRARAAPPTRVRSAAPEAMPWTRSGMPMISSTRLRGFSDACGSWKTITRSRRSARSLRAERRRDVLPVEADRARRRLVQPHDAAGERRLAAAGLADEAERLALLDGQADAVDGLQLLAPPADAAAHGEVLLHAVELKKRRHRHLAAA